MKRENPMTRAATDSDMATPLHPSVKIGVAGCTGRVGTLLVQELRSGHWGGRAQLAGGTVRPGYPEPQDGFFVTHDPEKLFEAADAVIDFTAPEATRKHAWLAAKHHKPLIIGTTGLSPADEAELHDAAKEAPIVYAANMSVGVNMLLALVEQAAARLGEDWDIEIFEAHHRHKVDAPSGTALALGKAAARGRISSDSPSPLPRGEVDRTSDSEGGPVFTYARHGKTGEREAGTIGFSVARGGDVVGDHTVYFYAEGERLELTHRATNRALFARGAIRAALWAAGQPCGLYSMRDVLGL